MKTNLEILESFCDESSNPVWMTAPFVVVDRAFGTDAKIIASIPLDKVEGSERLQRIDPKRINGVAHSKVNMDMQISVAELQKVIDNAPMVDSYDIIEHDDINCIECNGSGEVEWEYENHTKSSDCPICDGGGSVEVNDEKVKNGEVELCKKSTIKIANSFYYTTMVNRLLELAEELEVDKITLVHQTEKLQPSTFKIGDFDVVACPSAEFREEQLIATFK